MTPFPSRRVARDPATLHRSAEVLVAFGGDFDSSDEPSEEEGSDERPLRGSLARIAAGLQPYRAMGIDHLQVQLRPNRLDSVETFGAVIAELRAR